jgi:organic hydroperoxide reductase OsmC/OhrA
MIHHQYVVEVRWDSDRKGIMCSPDLTGSPSERGCIEVATPPQFPKGIAGLWSPEHLFTASVSSCFMTTFLAIAENSRLEFESFACKATGTLEQVDGKFTMSEVLLEPIVTVLHSADRERAERVLLRTEANCLISNSIKSVVTMRTRVEISASENKRIG